MTELIYDQKEAPKTLSPQEIASLCLALKDVIKKYTPLNEEEEFTDYGLELSEKLYAIANTLLQLEGEEGVHALEKILQEYLSIHNLDEFDVLHGTIIELMTSGYTDSSPNTPYTLVWLAATSFLNSPLGDTPIDFENIETAIQTAFFDAQITIAMDDVTIVKQALPIDFQQNVTIKQVYDFSSMHFELVGSAKFDENILDTEEGQKMKDTSIPTFYIPIFVKGVFGEVIENIYEKSEEVMQALERNSSLLLGEGNVVFHAPVAWTEATKENAEKMLNAGKLGSFFTSIAQSNNPHTEICVLNVTEEPNSYVLLYLDKLEGEVRGILYLQNENDYLEFMQEVLDLLFEYKLPLIKTDKSIPKSVLLEVIDSGRENSPSELSPESQSRLLSIFENSYDVDQNELYKVLTGSSLTVH